VTYCCGKEDSATVDELSENKVKVKAKHKLPLMDIVEI
jgi:hypothetical protein